jgi:hypothetical protein
MSSFRNHIPDIKDITDYRTSTFDNKLPKKGNVYIVLGYRPGKETLDGKIYEVNAAQVSPAVIDRAKEMFLKDMIKKHKL